MSSMAAHFAITPNKQILPYKTLHSPKPFTTNPITTLTPSLSSPNKPIINSQNPLHIPLSSLNPHNTSPQNPLSKTHQFIHKTLILSIFTLTLLSLRLISNILLPDFLNRWNHLIAFSEEAEEKCSHYPKYLWKAVVGYEDRRFFRHCGVDPVGIARAVLSFSALGGGSTITQQVLVCLCTPSV